MAHVVPPEHHTPVQGRIRQNVRGLATRSILGPKLLGFQSAGAYGF